MATKGLGRGLDALFGDKKIVKEEKNKSLDKNKLNKEKKEEIKENHEEYLLIDIEKINPNPHQPRKLFNDESLLELAESIKNNGIIQPIIVSPYPKKKNSYIIVAGERRYRAAQKLKMKKIPAIIRSLDDFNLQKQALIENIQRENLNIMEEAKALLALKEEHNMTQEVLAEITGKSRPNIAQTLRLLSLPLDVQEYLQDNKLSFGHARTLVSIENQEEQSLFARMIVEKDLSVRQIEEKIKNYKKPKKETGNITKKNDFNLDKLKTLLENRTQIKTKIKESKKGGIISFHFDNLDQLDYLLELLDVSLD